MKGRPGATYFIDINSYEDSIELTDGTYWKFGLGSKIEWDYFGAPLFWAKKGSGQVRVDDAHIVWAGDASGALPEANANTVLRPYFDAVNGSKNAYVCNWLLAAADTVTLNRPRCSAKVPGVGKSIYCNIRLMPSNDKDKGGTVIIHDAYMDDYVMGINGNGFDNLQITGTLRANRFDEYNQAGFEELGWAPGHLIYLSGNFFEGASGFGPAGVQVGHVVDQGRYVGSQTGGLGTQCVKFRYVDNLTVASVTSFRPGGIFDSTRLTNAYIGPLVYRDTSTPTDDFYTGTALIRTAINSDGEPDEFVSENIEYESIDLEVGTTGERWFNMAGNTVQFNNIVVREMRVKAANYRGPDEYGGIRFWNCNDCHIENLIIEIDGEWDGADIASADANPSPSQNCTITGVSVGSTVVTQDTDRNGLRTIIVNGV